MLAGVHEAFCHWRNRLIQSQRVQALAARTPGLRSLARKKARALFDLGAGFVYAQAYAACIELGVLEEISERGAVTPGVLAGAVDIPVEAAAMLLSAVSVLGLTEAVGPDRYVLGDLGAAVLANPGVREIIAHHGAFYRDLADPSAFLRAPRGAGALGAYWPYAGAEAPAEGEAGAAGVYSALMAASQPLVARETLAVYSMAKRGVLLDIGGGEGAFAIAAARRAPRLSAIVFDLPAVASRARARVAGEGLQGRIEVCAGDFLREPLPRGADVASLVRVLHDHDDPQALAILKAAQAALAPGGDLLIAEPMTDGAGARSMGRAYFGFYLHAMGSGRPRSSKEIAQMARKAGFSAVEVRKTGLPLAASVVVARS